MSPVLPKLPGSWRSYNTTPSESVVISWLSDRATGLRVIMPLLNHDLLEIHQSMIFTARKPYEQGISNYYLWLLEGNQQTELNNTVNSSQEQKALSLPLVALPRMMDGPQHRYLSQIWLKHMEHLKPSIQWLGDGGSGSEWFQAIRILPIGEPIGELRIEFHQMIDNDRHTYSQCTLNKHLSYLSYVKRVSPVYWVYHFDLNANSLLSNILQANKRQIALFEASVLKYGVCPTVRWESLWINVVGKNRCNNIGLGNLPFIKLDTRLLVVGLRPSHTWGNQ